MVLSDCLSKLGRTAVGGSEWHFKNHCGGHHQNGDKMKTSPGVVKISRTDMNISTSPDCLCLIGQHK